MMYLLRKKYSTMSEGKTVLYKYPSFSFYFEYNIFSYLRQSSRSDSFVCVCFNISNYSNKILNAVCSISKGKMESIKP